MRQPPPLCPRHSEDFAAMERRQLFGSHRARVTLIRWLAFACRACGTSIGGDLP